jgi:hypothetical protein
MVSVSRCSACSAELIPGANFCRQCGATVTSALAANLSEGPTLNLNERVDDITTQRLDPRATSPGRGSLSNPIVNPEPATSVPDRGTSSRRKFPVALLVGSAILIVTIAIIASVAVVRMRSHNRATKSAALIYPGAQTVVDMTTDEGRAIQLQTVDSLDRVLAWYDTNLKPTKKIGLRLRVSS